MHVLPDLQGQLVRAVGGHGADAGSVVLVHVDVGQLVAESLPWTTPSGRSRELERWMLAILHRCIVPILSALEGKTFQKDKRHTSNPSLKCYVDIPTLCL